MDFRHNCAAFFLCLTQQLKKNNHDSHPKLSLCDGNFQRVTQKNQLSALDWIRHCIHNARAVVFDMTHQWQPVLTKLLKRLNLKLSRLPLSNRSSNCMQTLILFLGLRYRAMTRKLNNS